MESLPSWRVYRGELLEVSGRLGDFHTVVGLPDGRRQELVVDQVVAVDSESATRTAPTGYHVLNDAVPAKIGQLAAQIDDLTGDFLKTVHVTYDADSCAGGGGRSTGLAEPAYQPVHIRRSGVTPQTCCGVEVDHLTCEGMRSLQFGLSDIGPAVYGTRRHRRCTAQLARAAGTGQRGRKPGGGLPLPANGASASLRKRGRRAVCPTPPRSSGCRCRACGTSPHRPSWARFDSAPRG